MDRGDYVWRNGFKIRPLLFGKISYQYFSLLDFKNAIVQMNLNYKNND